MTHKKLIEKAVIAFVGLVSCSNVIARLNEKREWLSPWVVMVLDSDLPNDVIVTTILFSLLEDCLYEMGESFARRSTAKYIEEVDTDDPFGEVLSVTQCIGHVWIRYNFSDSPLASIEIFMMDNEE